ncbi:hypothetical protein KP509_32G068000 [Ceratopteris richardii]|uniref:Phospholipase D n=3 Tax=Ceratopteris richardii TaxID=49495 RepID=A0A8T2QW58_CERRI|nr:hypothetical protein KP509_32G068000 [Ceratopteris richardii]KAH7287657.1 hypothetical protein KP509_32G068000 [Ceratopteris richardii]KAH7287661.1 hypothetical protein KP509_32G068000 [Ceratopteris richardii]
MAILDNHTHMFHGVLLATISEAAALENEHRQSHHFLQKLCTCFERQILEEIGEFLHVGKGLSKLYVTLDFGFATIARTRIVKRAPYNPIWNESFHVFCAYELKANEGLTIHVKDDLPLGAMVVGKVHIPPEVLLSGEECDDWFDICSSDDCTKKRGKIKVSLRFIKVEDDPYVKWGGGLKNPMLGCVHYSFFREEKGNKIRLYQDAHMQDGFMPPIHLSNNQLYQPARCWEDIYKAIVQAKHIIYIAGWSVYTKITLVRDMKRMIPGAEGVTLGELLKKKSMEGVRVLLLVWDDRTSISVLGMKTPGIMHTHDENTEDYFKGTNVQCVLCPRNPDDGASLVEGIQTKLMFTHHQKTLVVDVEDDGIDNNFQGPSCEERGNVGDHMTCDTKRRKLVAFLGGIDLCDGRYDTQSHSLFRTLGTSMHKDDFHQPSIEGSSEKDIGPREPWHDVHARIEGPCAWDVLYNFEQRWRRQAKGTKRALKNIKDIPELWPPVKPIEEDDKEAWNGQIFRSIDEGCVVGFPREHDIAAYMGLVSGKEHTIERSIQDAYISAIRRARNFVYMENQYFIGGGTGWSTHNNAGAIQLVPTELMMKIVRKIEQGERFSAFIVVPMWPEGAPNSGSVQEILRWQKLTMEMMYRRIARAIKDCGLEGQAKPTDYLNFFCLGNREASSPEQKEHSAHSRPHGSSHHANAQHHRRFMIYVHAKTMIVDDEYIIVGSANCNQRSMDGARDSEIAIGAYQPHNIAGGSCGEKPLGSVHGFRLSLWYEHLGELHDDYLHPESIECVSRVRARSQHLWDMYTRDQPVDMPGHLMLYPMSVSPNGEIEPLQGFDCFPDTNAPVLPTHTPAMPPILTV